jgi:ribosomal protein S12 methylthiotransferase
MKKKVGFVSLGCPKNLLDTEVMLGHMTRAGYELTSEPAEAEILVVNTCGFIDQAKQESIDTILEMAQYKAEGRCQRLVVAGCLAQRYAQDIAKEIPEIDVVTGLDGIENIVSACETGERRVEDLKADGSTAYLYDHTSPRVLSTPRFSAYIKISEGCDYPCTFCIIPKIRGSYRSRTPDSILAEAGSLAAKGVREIVLIAQDTTRYGRELGLRNGLADLLRQLARVDGIEWVRFLYAYPTTITDPVLEAMAEEPKVCRYVDMPLQHASDPILKAMKRPGTARSNRQLIENIRAAVPGVAIRSAFIVGYPGETRDDCQKLLDFCRDTEFDHLGVFTYSHEEDTEAFGRTDTVSAEEKEERRDALMSQQADISLGRNRERVGAKLRVLVEGPSPETNLLIRARTEGQAPEIDGAVLINDGTAEVGEFVTVEVTEAHPYDLVVRVLPLDGEGPGDRNG